jgi:hypothetical protein
LTIASRSEAAYLGLVLSRDFVWVWRLALRPVNAVLDVLLSHGGGGGEHEDWWK